jgi:hypothetical protein
MLSDPQSLTINAVATSLPKISTESNKSVYQKDDGTVRLTIQHSYGPKRNRRLVRIDQKKISSDPLVTANNQEYKLAVYLVIDEPTTVGFTVAERQYIVTSLADWLKASTNAATNAVLGGQS